jgi:hypothetical protein
LLNWIEIFEKDPHHQKQYGLIKEDKKKEDNKEINK